MSKALETAIAVLEGEIANFIVVDARAKTWEAVIGEAAIAALDIAVLDAVDSEIGHTAACEAVRLAEMTIVRLHCKATARRRSDASRDIAAAERDYKLRRFIVKQAWNAPR